MNDLLHISATDALQKFRSRSLSPVELIEAVIERAEKIQDTVNPFADKYFDEAIKNAKVAESKYIGRDERLGPLEGLPLAVKDSTPIQGRRSTNGSLINKNRIDKYTSPSIKRLLEGGANLFARTTCPEFCWLFTCHSRMWGITRNPWRLDITPGGSSGGSAAALAAGAATIATGSDSAGSIRQPSSQCGVVGYKPPYGRIPLSPSNSFDPFVQIGPMTRTVADAALMSNVMSGPHPSDHTSLCDKVLIPDKLPCITGMKIAVSRNLGYFLLADDVEREFMSSIHSLRDAGAFVEEISLSGLDDVIILSHGAQEFLAHEFLQQAIDSFPNIISDYVPELLETALCFNSSDFRKSISLAGEIWQSHFGPLFQEYEALLCPTVSAPTVPADNWQRQKIQIKGHQFTDTEITMTGLFNLYSRCPVLSVPCGMTDEDLPCGLQIIGRPCDDITVFQIGAAIEKIRPWAPSSTHWPSLDLMKK